MSDTHQTPSTADQIVEARRREMAVEHLVFGALRYLAGQHPGLIDELDASLSHLWDRSGAPERDDEAVRAIARRFIASLRAEAKA